MRKGLAPGVKEDKRKGVEPWKLRSKWISEDLEKQILEVGGFSTAQIYNRRGGLAERGLACLLEPGDKIVEVLTGRVKIQTREGAVQTFYNLDVEHDFLKKSAEDKTI